MNKAAEKLGLVAEEVPAEEETLPEAEVPAEEAKEEESTGKTSTASSKGYAGPVAVTITLNDDDTIASLEVGDDSFAETQGIGSRAKEAEFTDRFIGKKVPLAEGDVDVLTGATVTSQAVIKAVNKAAEKLFSHNEDSITAKGAAKGFIGTVAVFVTFNHDMQIIELTIGDESFEETEGLGSRVLDEEFKKQFIGKTVPLQDGDIDTITNATVTSKAVIEAINQAAADLVK